MGVEVIPDYIFNIFDDNKKVEKTLLPYGYKRWYQYGSKGYDKIYSVPFLGGYKVISSISGLNLSIGDNRYLVIGNGFYLFDINTLSINGILDIYIESDTDTINNISSIKLFDNYIDYSKQIVLYQQESLTQFDIDKAFSDDTVQLLLV